MTRTLRTLTQISPGARSGNAAIPYHVPISLTLLDPIASPLKGHTIPGFSLRQTLILVIYSTILIYLSLQIPPPDDIVDVFDGYSFKGRHSILIDSDDEESGDEEEEEDESPAADEAEASKTDLQTLDVSGGESPEERTPEAHQPPLLEATVNVVSTPTESPVIDGIIPSPLISQEGPAPEVDEKPAPVLADSKCPKPKATRITATHPVAKASRVRREKSGVPALDRDLSDTIDEDGEMTEKEDDDDDWDFVEAADGEDRNGIQGTSLFARGVVETPILNGDNVKERHCITPAPASLPVAEFLQRKRLPLNTSVFVVYLTESHAVSCNLQILKSII